MGSAGSMRVIIVPGLAVQGSSARVETSAADLEQIGLDRAADIQRAGTAVAAAGAD